MINSVKFFLLSCFLGFTVVSAVAQKNNFAVIAYYAGRPDQVDSCAAEKLTHIIYSFCHLRGNQLTVDGARDSATIKNLVVLKKRNPDLKVILSLGGWGGCSSCSDVFSTEKGIKEFAQSVLLLNQYFKTDGIDLDWEYPAITGYPGHAYKPEDKRNFTLLVQTLRKTLGNNYEISFAAGAFKKFLDESVEWKPVMNEVNWVNLMTYDLTNGYSVTTGHHTPLYSTPNQSESTDNAVQYLLKLGIPANKLVIGCAFYGRSWENVSATNDGLYQSGKFKSFIDFKKFKNITTQNGFVYHWDDIAKAPFLYNADQKLFVTYDDKRSTELKTKYVVDNKLNGIMFWQITSDSHKDGLLHVIDDVKKNYAIEKKVVRVTRSHPGEWTSRRKVCDPGIWQLRL